ncbi:hypothetical protein AAG570_009516 [Ranatra chinensis]|uniref:Odorant receptor n=1 Tax=Ranatra chinensis TaxID=642074 RepID=A0ABD0YPB5_9HEMI
MASKRRNIFYENEKQETCNLPSFCNYTMRGPSEQCRWLMFGTGIFLAGGGWRRGLSHLAWLLCLSSNCLLMSSCAYLLVTRPNSVFNHSSLVALAFTACLHILPSYVNLLARRAQIRALVDRMDEVYLSSSGWQRAVLRRMAGASRRVLMLVYWPILVAVGVSFFISVLRAALGGYWELDVPVPFPPLPDHNFYRCMVQVYAYLIYCFCVSSLLAKYSLLGLLTLQMCGLMKILGRRLRLMKSVDTHGLLDVAATRRKMKECVIFHVKIIRLIKLLNSIFSLMLMLEFVSSSVQCCFAGYLCAKDRTSQINKASAVLTFISILLMPFLMCWCGSMTATESRRAQECLYYSGWEEFPPTLRKDVILMMTAWNDLVLSFKGIFVFKMEHYASILQASYSYFTLISSLE